MTDRNNTGQQDKLAHDIWARFAFGTLAILGAVALVATAVGIIAFCRRVLDLNVMLDQHASAILGLPLAAMVATIISAAVRALDGKIRFDLLGLKMEGASGVVVAWILVFLAIVFCIRILW